MPEHDELDAPEETTSPSKTSTTPNLRVPKADRWGVEDKKVDEAEQK